MSPLAFTYYSCPWIHTKGAVRDVFFFPQISLVLNNQDYVTYTKELTQSEKKNYSYLFHFNDGILKTHSVQVYVPHQMVIIQKYYAFIKDYYFGFSLYLFMCLFCLSKIRKKNMITIEWYVRSDGKDGDIQLACHVNYLPYVILSN